MAARISSFTARMEHRKQSNSKKKKVQTLRQWILSQNYLPKVSEDDVVLFLRNQNYDVEAAKDNIENYFTFRTHIPEVFQSRDALQDEELQQIFNVVTVVVLQKPTKEGYKVVITRLTDTDPNKYNFEIALRYLYMVLDLLIYEEGTENGYLLVIDLNGATSEHITRINPSTLKKFLQYNAKAMPVKWRGLHYITTGTSSEDIESYVKKNIVKHKYSDGKVFFHPTLECFSTVVPMEILPADQNEKSFQKLHEAQINKLKSYRSWFLEMDRFLKVNEKLRPGDPIDARVLFEVDQNKQSL